MGGAAFDTVAAEKKLQKQILTDAMVRDVGPAVRTGSGINEKISLEDTS